ncbi:MULTISPECIES: CsbD family protein [Lactobacillus]|uniref:CsbD family protein n=1 Tax=Lactobacillus xujianguonis TaxID=2495899 RepID=A0A437SX59_9LACO|nr:MULTISPECIES: CsbD family protein [Lactobacillus]RVU71504.1 CsbD family protein [Lactobacillus xujianguonis]RVU76692.1 CsbD family protein [Lactobacillus xujianguonis]
MARENTGLKDKVVGKMKEVEGKLTGDKLREAQGKAQQTKGKVKDRIDDVRKNIEEHKEEKVT